MKALIYVAFFAIAIGGLIVLSNSHKLSTEDTHIAFARKHHAKVIAIESGNHYKEYNVTISIHDTFTFEGLNSSQVDSLLNP